jgi:hypothetical protein
MEPGEGSKPVGMSDARKRSTILRKIAQERGVQWPVAGAVPRRVSTASGISHRQKEPHMPDVFLVTAHEVGRGSLRKSYLFSRGRKKREGQDDRKESECYE